MACRLIGAKPSSAPMLTYFQVDNQEHFQWNINGIQTFPFNKTVVGKMVAIW